MSNLQKALSLEEFEKEFKLVFPEVIRFILARDKKILEAVNNRIEEIIQEERFSGTPYAMNKLKEEITKALEILE